MFAKTSDEVANVKLLPNQDGSSLGFEGVELKMLKYSVRQHRKLICSRNQLDPVADQFSAESKLPVSDRTLPWAGHAYSGSIITRFGWTT